MMEPLISAKDLKKNFGHVEALKGVSLDVAEGEKVVVIGPSGSGKSVLIRCMNALERPDSGELTVDGMDLMARKVNSRALASRVAMVFQGYNLYPHKTVLENVTFAPEKVLKVPAAEAKARALEYLERVGLTSKLDKYPDQLSGGQQQRVALARMLAARPGILMLDEPFSALDAHLKGVLEQNLVSLFSAFEGTILYVSHDIDEALRFCDRIAVVEAGRLVEVGSGDALVNRPQSVAGLKLSGCKNVTPAERIGEHEVYLPRWGIAVRTADAVPETVRCLGLRAFFVERASGPGENCYRVRVDRTSDSRFERTVLLGFLDRERAAESAVAFQDNEMSYLHQHLFWRVGKHDGAAPLPEVGDELWVRIPPDRVYLVTR